MTSRLKKAIDAVKDQTSISLAKVASNNTSHLEVAVLKATTHDDLPMDERYVYEILQLVSSNKLYAAACARCIGKRVGRTRNWIVALKSLMLVLRIFQDGDPYFPREILHSMKKGARILNLSNFRDDSNSSPWDFTAFVRTFALYLDERLDCFLTGKLQRRYTHRVREATRNRRPNEPVHDMKPSMLLDKISYWQRLLERAIATRPTGQAKHNRLVQICLHGVVQETFDLYKDVSDGLALLLDSFFHLQYQNCVSAFQTCVKASKLFEELGSFYSLCKTMGVGRTSEYPSVQTISEELMDTLREFLKDQSSFPATSTSPSMLMLPAPPTKTTSLSYGSDSYGGQSDFSMITSEGGFSDRTSEFGSQSTSLEELISATEINHSKSSISIDLEDYSEQLSRDKCNRLSDSGSTQSLPVTNSMVDLVSLDDWPDEQNNKEQNREPPENQPKGWDLVLAEMIISTPPPVDNHFNAFQEHEDDQKQNQNQKQQETEKKVEFQTTNSPKGWEFVLAEMIRSQPSPVDSHFNAFQAVEEVGPPASEATGWELALVGGGATPPPPPAQTMDIFYGEGAHQTSPSLQNYYNPFLQDAGSLSQTSLPFQPQTNSAVAATEAVDMQLDFPQNGFSTAMSDEAPTFQATPAPTFSVKNQKGSGNDPFGEVLCRSSVSMNQQDFVHEQQLWLQNQNKIIAKHIAS